MWVGGSLVADCAEVVVREVVDLLLWDETTGTFDTNCLPPTALPELHEMYQSKTAASDEGADWFALLSIALYCTWWTLAVLIDTLKDEHDTRASEDF